MNPERVMQLQDQSLEALDWQVVLKRLAFHAATIRGAAAAQDCAPAGDRGEAQERYAAVAELDRLQAQGESIPVGAVLDIAALVRRAGRGALLEAPQLQQVASCLQGLWDLRHWVEQRAEEAPRLDALAQPIAVDGELLYTLKRAFDDKGELSDEAWPELAELRRGVRATRRRIQSLLDGLLRSDALGDALQDRYITERGGRFVLPVKSARRSAVGIVHDISKSGETCFVEPSQVVEPQNRLSALKAQLRREERRILALLCRQVGAGQHEILPALEAAAQLDLACARAALGRELRGVIPQIGSQGAIRLKVARHPVLQLRGAEVVPNDLQLDAGHPGLVLTGPNAGGKTIALKTMGLAILFVRAGIPFPAAEDSRVDWFDQVLADVGDMQTVEEDLSTFSGHLLILKAMLRRAAPGVLLLLDEVAVGTDPAQGAALARAAIEAMVQAGARVVVTTHYLELKALASVDERFRMMGAQYEQGRPTWRLLPGLAGQSHALGVARRSGLPDPVLQRAEALMGVAERDLAVLMEQAEEELARVRQRDAALDESEQTLQQRERQLRQREAQLAARRERLEQDLAQGFQRRLRQKEKQVKSIVAALQANPQLARAGRSLQDIRGIMREAQQEMERPAAPAPPPPAQLAAGMQVEVPALGRRGRVVQVKGKRVLVEMGTLRSWLRPSELATAEAEAATAPTRAKRPRPSHPTSQGEHFGGVPSPANSCDLRGKRLEEAIELVERFLDDLLLKGEPVAFVLHGHGTGALKKGIRKWAPRSPYVGRWRPGQEGEGGDAWTVIELA